MPNAKIYISAFLMGGFYCAIGQLFLLFWSPIMGPAFSMAATLLSMGVIGVVLYITGIHQKLILVFNGFACALADMYESGAKEGGAGKGVAALLDLFFWVVGTGALLAIIVAVAAFFMA